MKGIRENIIDFEIVPTGNPLTLVFIDSSNYIHEPDSPRVQIFLPGFDKYFLAPVVAHQVNTFNSNTIGLTSLLNADCLVELPDGVYTIRYEICSYTTNFKIKNFCRTTLLEGKLRFIYDKLELSDCTKQHDERILNDLTEVHMLIEGCHYIADSDPRKATRYYAVAERLIKNIIKKIENCCK